ncbi:hypothetical protein [Pyrococcus yayanosii]|uniref:Uncharacterized protein n=1 Tax=Pyrococcus yayanosii (strain CH1 / JCM 16557) TaxID=529709 RepID=F8AHC8_PYRYC|nr:hypothetical protein [Pyrococcus yayanosii]AEH24125.1 hypothetical protein PYCH_04350 [Pyrococcus yayanosii CH1]
MNPSVQASTGPVPADLFLLALAFLLYYTFLKTSVEVFTYRRPSLRFLIPATILGTFITLYLDIFLGLIFLLIALLLWRLGFREAFVTALTAEFGFLVSFIVVVFFLTLFGTIAGIEGLELNVDWDELLHIFRGP